MSYSIEFSDDFLTDIKKHQKAGNLILLKKIDGFINEIRENPFAGLGKPEQLKFMEFPTWSRQVNKQHRLVYEVDNLTVKMLSAWGHYRDK